VGGGSHLLAGITPGPLREMLRRNAPGRDLRSRVRLAGLWRDALWAAGFAAAERRAWGERIAAAPNPTGALIIVGHWRTGTTYLHQLLSLDPGAAASDLFTCCLPSSFLSSRRWVEPVMARFLPPSRPMDAVALGTREPHEDEFATWRLSGVSSLEGLIFPRPGRYFVLAANPLNQPEAERDAWREAFVLLLRKLSLAAPGKRLLLKNPLHTLRIPLLARLLPGARFVLIGRDPAEVLHSTRHLWSTLAGRFALRPGWSDPSMEELAEGLGLFTGVARRDLAALPAGSWCEADFADLERRPLECVAGIHARLGLPFEPAFESRLAVRLADLRGYRKNRYPLDPSERRRLTRLVEKKTAATAG
jgi:hypothetical protein